MKRLKNAWTYLLWMVLMICSHLIQSQDMLIPYPSEATIDEGQFILDDQCAIQSDEDLRPSANLLRDFIENGSDIRLSSDKGRTVIWFSKDSHIDHVEGYEIHMTSRRVDVRARTDRGAFYAVQTLRQLLPHSLENGSFDNKEIVLPQLFIADQPRFSYRGMHLDVCRHFFPVEFIKKYIDYLAMLKMNTFHWHLTEDQGWRIEIKEYPRLQSIAAQRNKTLIGHGGVRPFHYDGKRYGGYYTQDEVKDIVDYAAKRHITIIPEIEMPGHTQAAISAYPVLSCRQEPIEVATRWGVFEDIYCTRDTVFSFLENVLDEIIELFPGEYIHIGGDEAPKTRWKACRHCQMNIEKNGLRDEAELQSYFIRKIEKYLNSKGRKIIGWDEILEGGLAPNATVMSWRGESGAIKAAKDGHDVILTPNALCYFDHYQSKDTDNEPLAIGGYTNLAKVYLYDPVPDELFSDEEHHVLGVQGNVWTEYMKTPEHVEYMIFPRILAMSEIQWTDPDLKSYEAFKNRVINFFDRLDRLGTNYADHIREE